MKFYVGIPEPAWAGDFENPFISMARLRRRKSAFPRPKGKWGLDCAGFSEVALTGGYSNTPEHFAAEATHWVSMVPGCAFVVSQDYMCEPFVLAKTGLTQADHQRLTIERYDAILAAWSSDVPLVPVLQGFSPTSYVEHLRAYGDRIGEGAMVGVGSVCKRQGAVSMVEDLLGGILHERPDLRLHGFGVKLTALESPEIRSMLESADSMAWAYAARKQGRNPNDRAEAHAFVDRISRAPTLAGTGNLLAHRKTA